MERWQKILAQSERNLDEVAARFGLDADKVRRVADNFHFQVSPAYWKLIETKDDPIYRQCIPDEKELSGNENLLVDPLGEEPHAPTPSVVHRYPDRCILLVSDCCATYCRFCTRKRKFARPMDVSPEAIARGIEYIAQTPAIRDVLVSGGDPFLLNDEQIESILARLRAIRHVEIIRIGTRTPCMLPERITAKLCRMLKKFHPLYINVHFNHPRELTPEAMQALNRLADAGIALGNQTVLLKGVNDDPVVMTELVRKLLQARVRPYYIHQCDLVYGVNHFRVPLKRGVAIMDALRGWTSGLAVPQYAVDLPGGGGKVTLVPEYCTKRDGKTYTFRNYKGDEYRYPEVAEDAP